MPSKREADFQKIFGDKNWPAFKTCFVGDPDLPILLEADYRTAEVMAIAQLSHDDVALEILNDPNRDIHSELAVSAFKLPYNSACGILAKEWLGGVIAPAAGKINKVLTYPDLNGGEVWIGDQKVEIWPGYIPIVKEGDIILAKSYLTQNHSATRVSAKSIVFGQNSCTIWV